MKIDVKNTSGKVVGSVELDDAVFGAEVNEHLLWEVVKWQQAKKRSGTASTRTVAFVHGTNKKPYRQKGTGNARQGTVKGHHHVGGGRAFGPKPRDYEYALPKKVRKAGLRSVLSLRAKESKLIVLDEFALGEGKTKLVAKALETLGVGKVLIIDGSENQALVRGTKNLKAAKWLAPEGLNVYDVLNHETLIITKPTAEKLAEALRP